MASKATCKHSTWLSKLSNPSVKVHPAEQVGGCNFRLMLASTCCLLSDSTCRSSRYFTTRMLEQLLQITRHIVETTLNLVSIGSLRKS